MDVVVGSKYVSNRIEHGLQDRECRFRWGETFDVGIEFGCDLLEGFISQGRSGVESIPEQLGDPARERKAGFSARPDSLTRKFEAVLRVDDLVHQVAEPEDDLALGQSGDRDSWRSSPALRNAPISRG